MTLLTLSGTSEGMYAAHFRVEDQTALLEFIEREPFGVLVSSVEGKPFATHLPFVVLQREAPLTLGSHVARANPQWETLEDRDVLAIFHGPHGMISAGWYAQPQTSVPTWNYAAVHCTGTPRRTDAAGTRRILERMVAQFEPSWRIESAQPEYIARMERAIVGVEIAVTSVTGTFKHSQNRDPEDRRRILEALTGSSRGMDRDLARAMRHTLHRAGEKRTT